MLNKQFAPTYTVQMLPEENIREQREQFQKFVESLGQPSMAEAEAFVAEREPAEPEEDLTEEIVYRIKAKIAAANVAENEQS
jgi:crotonobetainyl-CoA:carnitine CoA-transferase CaiB-like acyl-CoA transferase